MSASLNKITVIDSAIASDGGSLVILSIDTNQAQYDFHLHWSIEAQVNGTTQLYVNDVVVPKGSQKEKAWLDLLANADAHYGDPDALGEDCSEAVRDTIAEMISRVRSEAYQQSKGTNG